MLSLETALHFVYDVIHVDVKKIFHVILGQINKLASYLLLICRQKKVKRLVRKPHLQDLVPRLAEKKIWMHLVQEIMIMEMNLMTLCENDAANQVHRLKNMELAQQCSNQHWCGLCCFLSFSQHLCFVNNLPTQKLSIFIK